MKTKWWKKAEKSGDPLPVHSALPSNSCYAPQKCLKLFVVVLSTKYPTANQRNCPKVNTHRLWGCGLDFGLNCHFKGLEAENRKNKATFIPEAQKVLGIKVALFFQFDPSKPDFQKSRPLSKAGFWKKSKFYAKKPVITCNSFWWAIYYGPIPNFWYTFHTNNSQPWYLHRCIKWGHSLWKNRKMAFFVLYVAFDKKFFALDWNSYKAP